MDALKYMEKVGGLVQTICTKLRVKVREWQLWSNRASLRADAPAAPRRLASPSLPRRRSRRSSNRQLRATPRRRRGLPTPRTRPRVRQPPPRQPTRRGTTEIPAGGYRICLHVISECLRTLCYHAFSAFSSPRRRTFSCRVLTIARSLRFRPNTTTARGQTAERCGPWARSDPPFREPEPHLRVHVATNIVEVFGPLLPPSLSARDVNPGAQ